MKQWLQKSSPRERGLLIGGVVVLLVSGLYAFTYQPIIEDQQRLNDAIDAQQRLQNYLQTISTQALELRAQQPANADAQIAADQSPMSVIDSGSEQAGIKPTIKRLVPEGQDNVTLWLEKCPFDVLMGWLAALESQNGISVKQLALSRDAGAMGLVSGKVLLGR
jgi:general secretion pathway protein M